MAFMIDRAGIAGPVGRHRDAGPAATARRAGALVAAVLVMVISVIVNPATASAEGAPDRRAVDRFVTDYLARHGLPGGSVAIVKDGTILHAAGYGARNDERNGPDTPLAVGSVSKTLTAFAVLQLVDDGKIALDDPVIKHLPELTIDDSRGSAITVRHLLSHTSGLPDPVIVRPADTIAATVARLGDWQLTSAPGAKYRYSNANYWTASRLVEVVSGTPFERYLRDRVFVPLGMADSRVVITTAEGGPGLDDGYVTAYGAAVPGREMVSATSGSGGVITTAADLGRFLAMQQRGGLTEGGDRLLSASLIDQSHAAQPGDDRGGLGWRQSGPAVTPERVGKSGNLSTHNAQIDLVPGSGYGVAVLLNSFTTTKEHAYAISSGIIELTEGTQPELGAPVPTIIDLGLGLVTVLVIIVSVGGVLRSRRWADRRSHWARWRFGLRLLPHLITVAAAVAVFGVVPQLQDNPAVPADVFVLWPAGAILLLVAGLGGLVITGARVVGRARLGR